MKTLDQQVHNLFLTLGLPLLAGATDTEVATGDAITVKRWEDRLWIEMPRQIYWSKFMKKDDMNAIIEVKESLMGQPGDQITFTLLRKLSGGGVSGDSTMEGSEEVMVPYSDTVVLDQLRNAIRLKGKLSERRTAWSQRNAAKTLLQTWMAETIDDDVFTQFDTSPTTVVYGGSATATANITASDAFAPVTIDKAVAKAKKAAPKVWAVKINGREWYVVLIHTDVAYDLRQNSTWLQAQREANIRGDENPIFNGMLGIWNGCVVHEHEKVPISTTYGALSNLPGASNFFLGRQAGLFAWGQRPQWWEKEFDYGNKTGFCIGAIWDFTKAVFNSADHAFMALRTYRTNN